MDTTKLKSRGFATGKAAQRASGSDSSSGVNLWTETPAERQERLRDEMLGKKRKAENAPAEEETDEARRKRLRDQQLKDEVERHNVGDLALSRHLGGYAADGSIHPALAFTAHSAGRIAARQARESVAGEWQGRG